MCDRVCLSECLVGRCCDSSALPSLSRSAGRLTAPPWPRWSNGNLTHHGNGRLCLRCHRRWLIANAEMDHARGPGRWLIADAEMDHTRGPGRWLIADAEMGARAAGIGTMAGIGYRLAARLAQWHWLAARAAHRRRLILLRRDWLPAGGLSQTQSQTHLSLSPSLSPSLRRHLSHGQLPCTMIKEEQVIKEQATRTVRLTFLGYCGGGCIKTWPGHFRGRLLSPSVHAQPVLESSQDHQRLNRWLPGWLTPSVQLWIQTRGRQGQSLFDVVDAEMEEMGED